LAAAVSIAIAGCSAKAPGPAAAPDAAGAATPASAAASADSGSTNPLIGSWALVSADNDTSCPDSIQFTADSYTTNWKGVVESKHALYHAYPGYIDVFLNSDISHYLQFNLTSADVITNVTGNQYAMNNCPYNRS
jgi:hypothetical protein